MEYTRRHQLPADLAGELRQARLRRGLGLRQAARRIGIPPGYLCLLEQGKRCPSVAVARPWLTVLQLELDELNLRIELLEAARPDAGRSWRPT